MEAKAVAKFVRITPRKVRRVVDLIRGKRAADAMLALRFMPYKAARNVEKLLKSAMANAEGKDSVDAEQLTVSKVFVDQGPTMKRMLPRSMGRANIIKKKSSHITLFLSDGKQKQGG